jgi:hypothetical protein
VRVDGDTLRGGYDTLAEAMEAAGFATGGFVSSRAISAANGFAQGFHAYDDGTPAVGEVKIARLLFQRGSDRDGTATIERARRWIERQGEGPFFLLVEGDLAPILEALPASSLVVATSTGGGPAGLSEAAVRVPLIVAPPAGFPIRDNVKNRQVRLMDVPATILAALQRAPMAQSEGVDLLDPRRPPEDLVTLLWGDGACAYRTGRFKYMAGRLYDLYADRAEQKDIAAEQKAIVETLRARVMEEASTLCPR